MAIYYVSATDGNNSNIGTSISSAFATLQQAANVVKPGDTVEVESGTYALSGSGGYVLNLTRSGTASAPITFEAAPGAHPVIDSSNQWAGIHDSSASYVVIQGFTITGDANNITLAQAQAQANNSSDPTTSGSGIVVQSSGSTHPTHITIQDNTVENQPGGGISVMGADYVSILNNTVDNNTRWAPFSDSGISVFQSYSSDSNTGTKIVIAGNVSYDNQNMIPWHTTGAITDGEGIIVDSNNMTGYNGHMLVANNVAYNNGGGGLEDYDSNNVTFIDNTTYNNDQSSNLVARGQIAWINASGGVIENNILDARAGTADMLSNGGATEDYNVMYGGNAPSSHGAHDIFLDPKLVSPGTANFQLQSGSPAINAANPVYSMATDIAGHPRSASTGYDIGAYQHAGSGSTSGGGSSSTSGGSGSGSGTDTLTLKLSEDYWKGNAEFDLSVNGTRIATNDQVTTPHSSGGWETFTFTGNWGSGPLNLAISYVNDAYGGTPSTDRNLYLGGIGFNGTHYNDTAALYSDGTKTFTVG